uniref:L1 transposable element RRM domain-containing protein n=1 Tax=Myripristis murdjan TaxID=586833 RepID=A0A668AJF4_9TELE
MELARSLACLQTTVQQLGGRLTEAETRISNLEDGCCTREKTLGQVGKTVEPLKERVNYLEDAGRRNNVRIVGVKENSEAGDMEKFVRTLLEECLDMEADGGFEIERAHRCGPKPNADAKFSWHILVKFLRFSAREAVLCTAREKGYTEWKGQRIFFSQDLSRDTIQKRKKYDEVKRQLRSMTNVSYAMLYPDTLRITVNNKCHLFTTPAEAKAFISTLRHISHGIDKRIENENGLFNFKKKGVV